MIRNFNFKNVLRKILEILRWTIDQKLALGSLIIGLIACIGTYLAMLNRPDNRISQTTSTVAIESQVPTFFRRILFVSNQEGDNEIYGIYPDGSGEVQLTNNNFHDTEPAWSPDGNQIAFVSMVNANSEIYVLNASGTHRLTSNDSSDFSPSWSPDDDKIAFVSARNGHYEIYVMRSDGTEQKRVTYTANFHQNTSPVWSPSGDKIAFVSDNDVCIVNAFSLDQVCQPSDNGGLHENASSPKWSPDGQRIVYVDRDNAAFDYYDRIFVMNVDFSNPLWLSTEYNEDASDPTWSPDGSKIVFDSNRDFWNYEIYTIKPDGSQPTRLTRKITSDLTPIWSPDGSQIAYIAHDDRYDEICIVNIESSEERCIARQKGSISFITWQP